MKDRIAEDIAGDVSEAASIHSTSEAVLAVALSMCKEGKRLQLTQLVSEKGSFQVAQPFISKQELSNAYAAYEEAIGQGIEVMMLTESRYPKLLREINAPPPVLYIRQRRMMLDRGELSIAIVGTRAAGIEVCEAARQMGCDLSLANYTVVSGLALGIDGAAHRGALCSQIECPTIAVLAHGLDRIYPPSHRGLAEQILDCGGVLVSEYPPGVEPRRHHFLARNRIIAGLVRGVVVVQAGARSGSLVTASFAADYGRDVFVLQLDASDECSAGNESLIEQGAIVIKGVAEVLREYGTQQIASDEQRSEEWHLMSTEALFDHIKLSGAELLRWELEGRLVRLPGNRVRVRGL